MNVTPAMRTRTVAWPTQAALTLIRPPPADDTASVAAGGGVVGGGEGGEAAPVDEKMSRLRGSLSGKAAARCCGPGFLLASRWMRGSPERSHCHLITYRQGLRV